MASKQGNIDKSKPIEVSFTTLMKMGLSSKTEWPGMTKNINLHSIKVITSNLLSL